MGANIPLPALQVQPAQMRDPLEEYSRVAALKTQLQAQQIQQQQIEQRQQALNDSKAATAAMGEWDANADPHGDSLPQLILRHGGSATAAQAIQQHNLDQKAKLSQIAKDDAETGAKNIETLAKKNDYLYGKLQSAMGVPDDQLVGSISNAVDQSVQEGMLDPQHAMQFKQVLSTTADAPTLRSQLGLMEKSLQAQSEQFKQAQEERKTAAAEWKEFSTLGVALNTRTGETKQIGGGMVPPAMADTIYRDIEMRVNRKQHVDDDQLAWAKAYEKQKTLGPVAQIAVQGALNKGSSAALADVPAHLAAPATADFQKAGQEYAGAKQAAEDMKTFISLARSGNKLAYAYSPTEGVLTLNTGRGVKRVNMAEIHSYGGAGSTWDRIQGWFGKHISGASIPADILDDMETLHGAIAGNAKNAYGDKVKVINQSYGSKFQPIDLNQETPSKPSGRRVIDFTK
jgi:hypothetical protein